MYNYNVREFVEYKGKQYLFTDQMCQCDTSYHLLFEVGTVCTGEMKLLFCTIFFAIFAYFSPFKRYLQFQNQPNRFNSLKFQ